MKTHLFCLDDHRLFTEDLKKKFDDQTRYIIDCFQTRDDFYRRFLEHKDSDSCKIAILAVHDTKEQVAMIDHLSADLTRTDPGTGIILLCPVEKLDEIKKNLKFNIDSYIPQNGNAVLRIHNTVKKLFSEHYMKVYRRRRNRSLLALGVFLVVTGLFIILALLKFPEYF